MKATFTSKSMLKEQLRRTRIPSGDSLVREEQAVGELCLQTPAASVDVRVDDGFVGSTALARVGSFNGIRLSRPGATTKQALQQAQTGALNEARTTDPVAKKLWDGKYKYFSGNHMRSSYHNFSMAQHDPLNKDPAWGDCIIADLSSSVNKRGIKTKDLFTDIDLTGDGALDRAEMRRVLCTVQPSLSDIEANAVFDAIDMDRSGQISVNEFRGALEKAGHPPPEPPRRHRNPVHHIGRLPPAKVDGFDHVLGLPHYARPTDLCDQQQEGILRRLTGLLHNAIPRGDYVDRIPKYQYFNGGADSCRFRRKTPRVNSTPQSGRSAASGIPGMSGMRAANPAFSLKQRTLGR